MDFLEACQRFLAYCEIEKKLSALTLRAYRGDLEHFLDVSGQTRPLAEFSETWIEQAVQKWQTETSLKATTIKRRAACIKALARWLFRRKLIAFNPLERLDLEIRLPKRLPRNLHTGELHRLVAIKPENIVTEQASRQGVIPTRAEWDKLTARLAIEIMTLTGVRVGELVKIQLHDIDYPSRQIRIFGKGCRERRVLFPDEITTARLKRYREYALARFGQQNSETLLLNGMGHPANEQYIRRVVRGFAESVDLPHRVTPHMLRHTAATQLLEAGLDIRFVQKLLGHASITTTEIYTHVADHTLREKISGINIRRRLEM